MEIILFLHLILPSSMITSTANVWSRGRIPLLLTKWSATTLTMVTNNHRKWKEEQQNGLGKAKIICLLPWKSPRLDTRCHCKATSQSPPSGRPTLMVFPSYWSLTIFFFTSPFLSLFLAHQSFPRTFRVCMVYDNPVCFPSLIVFSPHLRLAAKISRTCTKPGSPCPRWWYSHQSSQIFVVNRH